MILVPLIFSFNFVLPADCVYYLYICIFASFVWKLNCSKAKFWQFLYLSKYHHRHHHRHQHRCGQDDFSSFSNSQFIWSILECVSIVTGTIEIFMLHSFCSLCFHLMVCWQNLVHFFLVYYKIRSFHVVFGMDVNVSEYHSGFIFYVIFWFLFVYMVESKLFAQFSVN